MLRFHTRLRVAQLWIGAAALALAAGNTTSFAQAKSSTSKPAPRPAAPVMPRALLDTIQQYATDAKDCRYQGTGPICRVESDFFGLTDFADGSAKLSVHSQRQVVAYSTWKASSTGGRFRVPPGATDVVMVNCGDSDLGDIFECSKVTVVDAKGNTVRPSSYKAARNPYRNALGSKWTVREVDAEYPIGALKDGFEVIYADFGSTEWTFKVTAEEAEKKLLLRIGDPEKTKQ